MAGVLGRDYEPRYVFLVGVLPAVLVWWIRRHVPEPEEWALARAQRAVRGTLSQGVGDLFRGTLRGTTLRVIGVCACSLTAWWAVLFWSPQHLRNLPELADWESARREQLVSTAFFVTIFASVFGNFFAAILARALGYRRAIVLLCAGFLVSVAGAYGVPRGWESLRWWIPWIGFFSGVFALFTMYLPPLFPTLLRTTGAGFCYNVGRVAAAVGTVVFGLMAQVTDLRRALVAASLLFVPAILVGWGLPELREREDPDEI
jgi:MFS family permease